jgi:hypothetical protein
MKKLLLAKFISFFTLVLVLSSCSKDKCTTKMTYVKYEPVYKTLAEIRQPVSVVGPRAVKNPGKIYLYHSYLLINEQLEGIHLIDNSNPSNPVNVAFIKIEGNLDMAIKGNMLFADNYIDLVTIDLSNPLQATLVDRDMNVFPNYGEDIDGRLCVAYSSREVTEDIECGQISGGGFGNPLVNQGVGVAMMSQGGTTSGSNGVSGRSGDATAGVGGSMARFTVNGNYLYTVDNSNLHTFDISNLSNPSEISNNTIGWANIETIFPYQNMLFIGSNSGMFIYDLINPASPQQISVFEHANACDPVFVNGNRAYVTLRGGNRCQNFTNQLDIVDITNIQNPTLVTSHPMFNPHGLSIKNNVLYLCDGDEGLKVFDASNDIELVNRKLYQDNSIATYDVIASPYRDVLLVIGKDGLFQYDISNNTNLVRLSSIPVQK